MAIVVDVPIIHSPFEQPTEHWALRAGKSDRLATARPPRRGMRMPAGSGRAVAAALLSARRWLNTPRQPEDRRYSDAVLVLCPNLTVKERLAVLQPAAPENYYEAFDLVPAGLSSAL